MSQPFKRTVTVTRNPEGWLASIKTWFSHVLMPLPYEYWQDYGGLFAALLGGLLMMIVAFVALVIGTIYFFVRRVMLFACCILGRLSPLETSEPLRVSSAGDEDG